MTILSLTACAFMLSCNYFSFLMRFYPPCLLNKDSGDGEEYPGGFGVPLLTFSLHRLLLSIYLQPSRISQAEEIIPKCLCKGHSLIIKSSDDITGRSLQPQN